jgi:hypothetical protein
MVTPGVQPAAGRGQKVGCRMPKYRFDGIPRVTLRNIRRLKTEGCGWRVNVKRQRKSHVR